MNRLWLRLSVVYVTTILVIFLTSVLLLLLSPPSPEMVSPGIFTAEEREAWEQLRSSPLLQTLLRQLLARQFLGALVVIILAGVVASVWASYRLTRPLARLESATRRVGRQGDRPRVPVEGTAEMIGLAEAFNGMVEQLEAGEARRRALLADVSHELRTPLTILQGNLRRALDEGGRLDPRQVATLYDQSRQLGHLVDDLHDLAQAESDQLALDRQGLDLDALVRQAADLFAPLAAERGLRLVVAPSAPLPPVRADRARLGQVLQNLLANALRYARGEIRLALEREQDEARLHIADDGAGIAAQHLPHLFDRFYRPDASRSRASGGSGLGLAIVRSIVEAHGWSITVRSHVQGPEQGTTFTIAIPLNPPPPERSAEAT